MPKTSGLFKKRLQELSESDSDSEEEFSGSDVESDYEDMSGGENDEVENDDDLDADAGEIDDEDAEDDDDDVDEEDDEEVDVDEDAEEVKTRSSQCLYRHVKKTDDDDDDEDETYIEILSDDEDDETGAVEVPPLERITTNRLTKYEEARILGVREKQLSKGAKPMIRGVEDLDPRTVAEMELAKNTLPFKIRRPLPGNRYEIWSLAELEKPSHI